MTFSFDVVASSREPGCTRIVETSHSGRYRTLAHECTCIQLSDARNRSMGAKVTCKGRDLSESFGISSAAFYFDGKKTHCARIQGFVHAVYAK